MAILNFTEPELVVMLAKTYKSASRNNLPTSTHTTSIIHIATKRSDQPMIIAPSPTQPEPQQQTSSICGNY